MYNLPFMMWRLLLLLDRSHYYSLIKFVVLVYSSFIDWENNQHWNNKTKMWISVFTTTIFFFYLRGTNATKIIYLRHINIFCFGCEHDTDKYRKETTIMKTIKILSVLCCIIVSSVSFAQENVNISLLLIKNW